MSKHIKKLVEIISYLSLFSLIVGLIFYYGSDLYSIFNRVNWWIIGLLIFLQIPMIALGGFAFKILCTAFHIHLRWQDWAGLSFIANFLNQLLPYRPGVGFRYLYLRQNYKMKTTEFIYVMLVYLLLTLIISALFTIIGWLFGDIPNSFNQITLIALLLVITLCGFILWLKTKPLNSPKSTSSIPPFQIIHKTLEAIHILIKNPVVLLGSSFSLILVNVITALIFYSIFVAIGFALPFADCIFLVGIITIAMIFPITPGNIGVLETLVGTLTQMMYNDFSVGFSVTALFRASQWVPSIVLGTSFSLILAGSFIPNLKNIKLGLKKTVD